MEKKYTKEEQKQNRKLWIEALRSGEYQQTRKTLKSGNRYCCLGVLCEVARHHGVEVPLNHRGEISGAVLNEAVINWVGLKGDNGPINDMDCLTHRNDNGATFQEIAQIIESEPEGLVED